MNPEQLGELLRYRMEKAQETLDHPAAPPPTEQIQDPRVPVQRYLGRPRVANACGVLEAFEELLEGARREVEE